MNQARRGGALTKAEQRAFARYTEWMNYRAEVSNANKRIRASKQTRKAELADLRVGCEAAAKKVRSTCATARKSIRVKAHKTEAQWKEHKRSEREEYSLRRGRITKAPKMTREESDSLAEHNIPDELIAIWHEDRKRYSYDQPPDMRAEEFLEWAEAHEQQIAARLQERLEAEWSDLAYARDLARQETEREERVPF